MARCEYWHWQAIAGDEHNPFGGCGKFTTRVGQINFAGGDIEEFGSSFPQALESVGLAGVKYGRGQGSRVS